MSQQLPITKLFANQAPPLALVCGDPARAEKTAGYLEAPALLSQNREYHIYSGRFQGEDLLVCSHGVGAPGAAIAFEELIAAGVRKMIRIGTCGGIKPEVVPGDLVIATAAIADIGYVRDVVPPTFPAVADPALTVCLQQKAAAFPIGGRIHSGIIITRDVFYSGLSTIFTPSYELLAQGNVLAVEMEAAALFVVGTLRGIVTAAILAVDGNVLSVPESMEDYKPDRSIVTRAIETEIQIALQALVDG